MLDKQQLSKNDPPMSKIFGQMQLWYNIWPNTFVGTFGQMLDLRNTSEIEVHSVPRYHVLALVAYLAVTISA